MIDSDTESVHKRYSNKYESDGSSVAGIDHGAESDDEGPSNIRPNNLRDTAYRYAYRAGTRTSPSGVEKSDGRLPRDDRRASGKLRKKMNPTNDPTPAKQPKVDPTRQAPPSGFDVMSSVAAGAGTLGSVSSTVASNVMIDEQEVASVATSINAMQAENVKGVVGLMLDLASSFVKLLQKIGKALNEAIQPQ